ncbi:MAG: quercetin 2,3-dioxygenase [Cyclobacteriaceae bacterium]
MNRKEFLKSAMIAGVAGTSTSYAWATPQPLSEPDMQARIIRASEGNLLNVLGDQQTVKLTGKDTNGQFTLIEEENAPGTMIPPHIHENEDEVFKVLEGQLELTVGDQKTVLNAGDLAFGPRGIPHSWKVVGDKNAKVILSVFPAGIETMFEALAQLPAGPPDFEKVAEICARHNIRFLS